MDCQCFKLFTLQLCQAAVTEYPEHLHLLYVKASLEDELISSEVALLTAKRMLTLWNALYKDQLQEDGIDSQSQLHNSHDNYSVFNLSDKDTGWCISTFCFTKLLFFLTL